MTKSRDKVCLECGKPFIDLSRVGKVLTCSSECNQKRHIRLTNESKARIKAGIRIKKAAAVKVAKEGKVDSICPYCRKPFKGDTKWQYCTDHENFRYETDYAEVTCGFVR